TVGQRAVYALGIGFGVLSHLVFGLGLLKLARPPVYVSLLVLLTVVCVPELYGLWQAARRQQWRQWTAGPADALQSERWLVLGLVTLMAGWLFVVLVEAVAPEIQYDALYYHLALPRIYLEQGEIRPVWYITPSYFYLGSEMLYLLGM